MKSHLRKVTTIFLGKKFAVSHHLYGFFLLSMSTTNTHTQLLCSRVLNRTASSISMLSDMTFNLKTGRKTKKIRKGRSWRGNTGTGTGPRSTWCCMETERWNVMSIRSLLMSILNLHWSCSCYVSSHRQSSGGLHRQRLIFNLKLTRFTIFSLIPWMSDRTWRLTPVAERRKETTPLLHFRVIGSEPLILRSLGFYCPETESGVSFQTKTFFFASDGQHQRYVFRFPHSQLMASLNNVWWSNPSSQCASDSFNCWAPN